MAFDDLDNFLEGLGDKEPDEDESSPIEYEVVEGFDFHNTDPLSDELLQYHTPQLNWLIREINNLKSYDDKDFDRLELKNQEIQDTIMDVVRVAKTSEKEGNQWKAEYQAQVEENARIGQDILRMTDKIEQIKGILSNSDNLMQEYDNYTEMKWRKTLRKLDKELKQQEVMIQDLSQRYEEEIKAFKKSNQERRKLLVSLDGIDEAEWTELVAIEKHKEEILSEMENQRSNPPPRKNILEEFKNRKQKFEEKKKSNDHSGERAETAGSRPGGRYTGKATPRGGTIHLAKGAKAQRDLRETEEDPFLRRGVYGSRIAVDRRGPDPVAALFNQSKAQTKVGFMPHAGNFGSTSLADDYSEFMATPRRTNLSRAGLVAGADDQKLPDLAKGPGRKSALAKNLPKIDK